MQDRSLPYIIGLVVLLIVGVILFIAFPSLFVATTPGGSPQPTIGTGDKPTIARAQAIVMPKSKLTLPAITKAVDIQLSAVPKVLRDAVPSDAKSITAKRLTDARGKTGYMIVFDLFAPIQTANRIMMLAFGESWQVLLNTYTRTFGLLELTGHNYEVQTQVSAVKDEQMKVVIRAHLL